MDKVMMSRLQGCLAALGVGLTSMTLAACGDDAGADRTTDTTTTTVVETTEQYGQRVSTLCPGGDPGFDPFLAEHPTPSATDWAEFLPSPLQMLTDTRECIATSNPPVAIADDVDAVVAAFDVVIDDFEKALTAAQGGDLATTDKWITQMHDIDQPKIEEAVAQVGVN